MCVGCVYERFVNYLVYCLHLYKVILYIQIAYIVYIVTKVNIDRRLIINFAVCKRIIMYKPFLLHKVYVVNFIEHF